MQAASKGKTTAEDIMKRYEQRKNTRKETNQSQDSTLSNVSNPNAVYAQQRVGALSDRQKDAIESYNTYMDLYKRGGFDFNLNGQIALDNAKEYLDKAMEYKRNSGMDAKEFDEYADNWKQYKDILKNALYQEKSSNALKTLSQTQKDEIQKYNLAKQQYENAVIQSGVLGSGKNTKSYFEAENYKKEFMDKYGVSDDEFERLAQYSLENADKTSMEKLVQEIRQDVKDDPIKYGVFYSALDLVSSPMAGMLAAGETIKSLGYADKDAPVNTNSPLYAFQNMGESVEEAVLEEIDNPVGKFAYSTGMSTGKSGLNTILGSKLLSMVAFGTSAYSSALKNAQDRGVSKERAMMTAVGAGAAELVFEKVSLDHLYDLYRTVGKTTLKDTVKNVLAQSGIEASEEVFTELSNIITDGVINGEFSEYGMNVRNYLEDGLSEEEAKRKATTDAALKVAEAGLAGFISGGVMGAGATAISKMNYANLGKAVNQDAETKSKVIETAQMMEDKTTAKNIVSNTKSEDITDAQMGEVLESMADVDANMVSSIFEKIEPVQSETESETLNTQSAADNRKPQFDNVQMQNVAENPQNETEKGQINAKFVGNETLQELASKMTKQERNHGVTKAMVTKTNQPVIAIKFDEVSKNKATVRLENDMVVPLEEVQMDSKNMQNLYNVAATMNDTKAANAMLDKYNGQPMHVYAQSCAVFYNAGQLKTASFEEMVQNPKNADLVAGMGDTATLYEMFSLGRNSTENIAPVQQNVVKGPVQEGKVIDNRTNKQETRIAQFAEMVAKRTGLEITLNDSLENGERGHFQAAMGRIALSSKADNQYEVLTHELMEYASTYNAEKMQKVYDTALSYAMSDMGAKRLTETIKAYQNAYEKVEEGKTYQSASEEFVHDYLAGMFMTPEGIQEMVDFMKEENMSVAEQKSILQTIADFFKDIANKIREYIDEHTMSYAAKKGLEADAKHADEMRQMVLEVLEDTIGSKIDTKNVELKHSLNMNFASEVDAWYNDEEAFNKKGGFFRVGKTSEALKSIGVKEQDITWDKSKIKAILKDHPEMTIDVIKKVPQVIENPIIVMQSKTRINSITVLGEVTADNELPVMVAMHLQPEGKSGRIMDMIKISNSYTRSNTQGLIDTSDILYVEPNKNRTDNWLSAFGLQLPVGLTNYGSIDRVTYYDDTVNKMENENSGKTAFEAAFEKAGINKKRNSPNTAGNESSTNTARDGSASNNIIPQSSKNTTKKSLKVELLEDSLGRKLSETQMEYFKDSKVRDENGALKVMYHGTPDDFTVFNPFLKGGINGTAEGYGLYFADTSEVSEAYGGRLMSGYLNVTHPATSYKKTIKAKDLAKLIKATAEAEAKNWVSDGDYDNVEDALKDTWVSNYVYTYDMSMGQVYKEVAESILSMNHNDMDVIQEVMSGLAVRDYESAYEFYDILKNTLGIDGFITEWENQHFSSKNQQIVIAFDSNQFKNLDNTTPTADADIRLSLDVDLMSILDEEYSHEENESASIIEEGFASLQNVTVDKKVMHRLAYNLKKEYKSAYSIDDLTNNLTNVFAYLKENPKASYQDMVRIMSEVARPVIEESTDVDTWEKAMYDNFRNYFKGKTIKLDKFQRDEVAHYFGSFENFRRKNFGSIQFSAKEGTPLDNLWGEIVQQSNFMLESDTVSADQPIALMDVMQALKPVKKNIYGMNTEQASYDLALDIFRQFFAEQAQEKANEKVVKKALRLTERQQEYRKTVRKEFNEAVAKLREVDKEKREDMRREYEIKLADAKKSMDAAIKDKDWKDSKHYEVMVKMYQKQIQRLNQETNEKILAIKAANRQNMANRRAYEEQKRVRERIVRNAKGIINYFNANTDKRHIPEILKTPIAQFITSIDFVSERANPNSEASLAWQDSLNLMYRRLSNKGQAADNGYVDVYLALNDENGAGDVLQDMNNFLEYCSGKRITDLSVRELEWLDGIITALKRAITDINRLYVNKRTQSVAELGTQSIMELSEKKDKKSHAVLVEKGMNVMDANMLDSRSYFDRLGEAAFSIYDELRAAFNERVWLLKESQDYMAKALDGVDVKTWTGENAKVHDFVVAGQHLQMTTAQIMSLYELNKRNQAKLHMTVGGIRPTVIGKGSKQIKRVKAVKLTSRDIDIICNTLTAEQKAVADKVQKFLANNCAKWGNKASMQMYGYERFGAENYFPIRTDGNTVDTKDDSKYWGLKNSGHTKSTVKNASNPLIVSDIFEVYTKHVTDMASYRTYTPALMDAMKWYNFRSTELQGDVVIYDDAVKTQIERVYGKTYQEYFEKLIEDINVENKHGTELEIAELLTSNMKAASVGANLRVAIQQPTAYLRAAAVIDPKYLSKAVFKKSAMEKAKEHSAITLWKSWGYFESSIGRSMQNVLTGQKTWKEEVVDKSMAMAQFMDDFTWGYLWNACEAEISDKYNKVEYDSPEYIKLVSARFDEVVDQTQVVDTVLHKSHIMRSKNMFNKMVTSFMSEPTKSYNLLMNKIRDVYEAKPGEKKKAKSALTRAVSAYVVTQVVNAFVVSFIDAFRDWDEDGSYWEKYWSNFKENAVDNTNPLTMIPYAKDVISLMKGYDVNRQDMQGVSKLFNGGRKIFKYITDMDYRKEYTLVDVTLDVINGGSQVTGISAYNPLRDFVGIWNTFLPDYPFGGKFGGRIYTKTDDYNRMINAIMSGDEKTYKKAYDDLLSKDNVEAEDVSGLVLSQIKKKYDDGELSKEEVTKLLREEYDYSEDDIWYKLKREWSYDSKYGLLYENIDASVNGASRTAIQSEIQELVLHGSDKSDIAAGITRKYKDAYLHHPTANMKNLLISCFMTCGYTREEALKKIEKWRE